MIKKTKFDELSERMERLGIKEDDLVEKFILGSGRGGQKVQKTSSTVYLKHIPTGTEVKCQQTRYREQNRYFARRELCDKIEQKELKEESAKKKEEAKIRKQKKRRSRRLQEKILGEKHHLSAKKELRKPPSE